MTDQKLIKSLSADQSILWKMSFLILRHSRTWIAGGALQWGRASSCLFYFMFLFIFTVGCKLFHCAFASKYHPMTESNYQYEIHNFLYPCLFVIKQDTYWFDGINCDYILLHLTLIIIYIKEKNWLSPFDWYFVMSTNKIKYFTQGKFVVL